MNRQQFIEKWFDPDVPNDARLLSNDLDSVIDAAVQAEREACAKVADESDEGYSLTYQSADDDYSAKCGYNEACSSIAAAIRARTQEPQP